MHRSFVAALAAVVLAGCATASRDRPEDATLVCVQNDTEHSLTVNIRDAGTRSILGQIHLSAFGSGKRWIRTGGGGNPIMVSVDALGVRGDWVPPAFGSILLSPGVSLSLTVGMGGVTPFAHSTVNAGCREVPSRRDTVSDSASSGSRTRTAVSSAPTRRDRGPS